MTWTMTVEEWAEGTKEYSQIVVSNDDGRIILTDFDTTQAQWLCDQLNAYEALQAAVRELLKDITDWHPSWNDDNPIGLTMHPKGTGHQYGSGHTTLGKIRAIRKFVEGEDGE